MGQTGFEPVTSRLSAERSYLTELLAQVGATASTAVVRLNITFPYVARRVDPRPQRVVPDPTTYSVLPVPGTVVQSRSAPRPRRAASTGPKEYAPVSSASAGASTK